MKIAIDLRALQSGHQNRGIGSYLLNILHYFPNEDTTYIFLRYDSSNPITDYAIGEGRNYTEVVYKKREFSRNPKQLLLFAASLLSPKYLKLMKHHPDVFFQPDYLLGIPRSPRIKKVVVAYDLIPLLFRNMYLPSWKKPWHLKQIRFRGRLKLSVRAFYYEKKYKNGLRCLRRANQVISISNTTTNDLIAYAHIPKSKINTIYLAPSFIKNHHISDSVDIKKLVHDISGKYLVFIGGTDARRKADELVYAFNLLNARGHNIHLVFAGNEFVEDSKELSAKTKKAIETSSYKDKIYLLGKISDNDKDLILSNALAFVYPTLYEGFGLPLLESMAAGCPVITFKNSATIEIAGDAALFAETDDSFGLYSAILKLMDNPQETKQRVPMGIEHAKQFSWDVSGQETVKLVFKDV